MTIVYASFMVNSYEIHGQIPDEVDSAIQNAQRKHTYTVWGIPPDHVVQRIKKLMEPLRAEFGGPEIEPHITVVGSVLWKQDDAVKHFVSGCENIEPYLCEVDEVVTRKFYYQPVSLLFHPCDWVCLSLSCYFYSCFVLIFFFSERINIRTFCWRKMSCFVLIFMNLLDLINYCSEMLNVIIYNWFSQQAGHLGGHLGRCNGKFSPLLTYCSCFIANDLTERNAICSSCSSYAAFESPLWEFDRGREEKSSRKG